MSGFIFCQVFELKYWFTSESALTNAKTGISITGNILFKSAYCG